MSTPIATAHRNLRQRVAKMLGSEGLRPWQLERIVDALDDLEFGRYPEGERVMSMAERPDLYEPAGYSAEPAVTVEDLRRRLADLAAPNG